MKLLVAPTEDFVRRSRTTVAASTIVGATTITLANPEGFATDDYICIGFEGSENAELVKITLSGAVATVLALAQAHSVDDPITQYKYNKRKFYGCATSTGSFVELTSYGSPVTIRVTDPQGTPLEYTGGEGYLYFKSTYYNSTASQETNAADANVVYANESSRYCSLYAIKKQAGLVNNPYITDGILETYRARAENEVNSYIYNRYVIPLQNSAAATEIPGIIENVTVLLAAGYMDYQEFGKDGEGVKWLGEARAVLKKIQDGMQRLIGLDGIEFLTKTLTQGVQSFPDEVDNSSTDGPSQKFTMNQRF